MQLHVREYCQSEKQVEALQERTDNQYKLIKFLLIFFDWIWIGTFRQKKREMYADRLKIHASSAVQSERKHNLKERRKDKRQDWFVE